MADVADEELGFNEIDTVVGISINGISFAHEVARNLDCEFTVYRTTDGGDGSITSEANLTYDGTDLTAVSSSEGKPVLTLKTTHTTKTKSAELQFLKDAADTEDGENLGILNTNEVLFHRLDIFEHHFQFNTCIGSLPWFADDITGYLISL